MVVAFLITGCEKPRKQLDPAKNITGYRMNNPNFQVLTIDECEYVLYCSQKSNTHGGAWASGLTHKGNCKFCSERKKL